MSKSVNRTNEADRKGYSESDQIMARALMTPDELRRMPSDQCIIFEKGLKPIKANKYWWYKKNNISRDLNMNRIDHNNYDVGERGEWRKYNPYNPYTGNQFEEDKEQSFKVDSLDDLFNDGETSTTTTTTITNASQDNKNVENKINDIQIEMPENQLRMSQLL